MFNWRKYKPLSLWFVPVFFGLLWCLGFPQPGFDDLYYTGAAINLANGGDFSNPMLIRQGFPSHFFYLYPPLHSYVLAVWLKIFGVNVAAQTGFAILGLCVVCWATISILRRHQAPVWTEWLVPLGVAFSLMPTGLRPEILAVALTMTGFTLAEGGGQSAMRQFLGFLLLFLGASCAPRVMCVAGALGLCAGYELLRGEQKDQNRRRIVIRGGGAVFATVFIFLVLIHFRVGEFWRTFHLNSQRVAGKPLAILLNFVKGTLGVLQWPVVLLPLVLLAEAIRKRPWDNTTRVALAIVLGIVATAAIGGIGYATLWWAVLLMCILPASFGRFHGPKATACLGVAMALILGVACRKIAVNAFGIVSGNIALDSGDGLQAVAALKPTPEHPLIVDSSVARYCYHYRLPPGTIDFGFCSVFPGGFPGELSDAELRPGDVYVIGPETLDLLSNRTHLGMEPPWWAAFGLNSFRYCKYPRQVFVIPSEKCGGARPAAPGSLIYIPLKPVDLKAK